MATASDFIIKCKTENGSCIVKNLTSESTVEELKIHLSKEFDMPPECIKIRCGYPPKALAEGSDGLKLKDVNISERLLEMALEIAREAKSSRQFTDVSNFTLRCMICDLHVRGEKEARDHALQSGHTNFGETKK